MFSLLAAIVRLILSRLQAPFFSAALLEGKQQGQRHFQYSRLGRKTLCGGKKMMDFYEHRVSIFKLGTRSYICCPASTLNRNLIYKPDHPGYILAIGIHVGVQNVTVIVYVGLFV